MPEVRMLVGLNRTATSAFLNAMVQNDKVYGAYEPIEWGSKASGKKPDGSFNHIDYSIFDGTHDAYRHMPREADVLVFKESIGGSRYKRDYPLFPDDATARRSRPIIVFRNPLTQWGGWLRAYAPNRPDLNVYIQSYKYLYNLYKNLESRIPGSVKVLTFENMISQPRAVFQEVCRFWGLPFDPAMVAEKWKIQFNDAIANHRKIYFPQVTGLVDADPVWRAELSASEGFAVPKSVKDPAKAGELITDEDRQIIQRELGGIYQEMATQSDRDFPVVATKTAEVKTLQADATTSGQRELARV